VAAFNQDTLEAAIHDWIAASLPAIVPADSAIRWANQIPPAADVPFALLSWDQAPRPMGRTIEPEQRVYDSGGGIWQLERTHRAGMVLAIDVTASAVRGSSSAPALLRRLLELQSSAAVRALVDALPAAVLRFDPPVDLSALVADQVRSRARMRVELYSQTTTEESGDYIDAGEFTATVTEV